jgi:cellulose biosynthesis protein BcsQ
MIISLYNIKGGVGKTSTTINLVSVAAKRGKTLLWDLDIQGASSFFLIKNPKKDTYLINP